MMDSLPTTEIPTVDEIKKSSLMKSMKDEDAMMNQNPEVFSVIPGVIQNMDVVRDPIKCFVQGILIYLFFAC